MKEEMDFKIDLVLVVLNSLNALGVNFRAFNFYCTSASVILMGVISVKMVKIN
jgi:hypothetical protein